MEDVHSMQQSYSPPPDSSLLRHPLFLGWRKYDQRPSKARMPARGCRGAQWCLPGSYVAHSPVLSRSLLLHCLAPGLTTGLWRSGAHEAWHCLGSTNITFTWVLAPFLCSPVFGKYLVGSLRRGLFAHVPAIPVLERWSRECRG